MFLISVVFQRLANFLRTFPCFATLHFFPFCSNLDLAFPIALPPLTASVLSRQSWDSQEGETDPPWPSGRQVGPNALSSSSFRGVYFPRQGCIFLATELGLPGGGKRPTLPVRKVDGSQCPRLFLLQGCIFSPTDV